MALKHKPYYGNIIVAYGVFAMLVLHYGCIGSQAIFMLPITKDLGVSTTKLTLASTYSIAVSLFWTPFAGKLMNRYSIRKLLFVGILGTGLTMIALGYVTSVYQYYAVFLVRNVFSVFVLTLSFPTLTARWFDRKNRSFATSIVFVGISLGGVLLSSPLTSLIETIGWRATYRIYGLAAVLLIAPLALLIIRDYPDNYEQILEQETQGASEEKSDFISLLKNPRFILLCVGMSAIFFVGSSLYHISSYVQSLGYSAQFGATIISVYNFVCLFSKMIMGRLFDKRGVPAGVLFGGIGILGAYSLMAGSMLHSSVTLLLVIAVFYGIGNTCQSMTGPAMVSAVFGVKNYSEIYAKMTTVTTVTSALGAPIISYFYESTGSYLIPWILCIALSLISTVSLLAVNRMVSTARN